MFLLDMKVFEAICIMEDDLSSVHMSERGIEFVLATGHIIIS